jgi:hypothetical protein
MPRKFGEHLLDSYINVLSLQITHLQNTKIKGSHLDRLNHHQTINITQEVNNQIPFLGELMLTKNPGNMEMTKRVSNVVNPVTLRRIVTSKEVQT